MNRLLALVIVALSALAAGVPSAGSAGAFVTNRAPMNQTMTALLAGKFYVEFRCAEECSLTTRLVMPPDEATDAGFKGVKAGKWFELGRIEDVQLKAGVWTKVYVKLRPKVKTVLAKDEDGVRFGGQAIAESNVSGRYGWANWIRTCKWPKA